MVHFGFLPVRRPGYSRQLHGVPLGGAGEQNSSAPNHDATGVRAMWRKIDRTIAWHAVSLAHLLRTSR